MEILIKILIIVGIVVVTCFVLSLIIYWFNLDTKLVKLFEKTMNKHYDKLDRDRRI